MRSRTRKWNTPSSFHGILACVCCFLVFLMVYTPGTLHPTTNTHNTQRVTILQPDDLVTVGWSSTRHSVKEGQVTATPWWDGGQCRCVGKECLPEVPSAPKASPSTDSAGVGGTCGRRAWAAGDGQRVVTLSLYGDNPEYWVGLDDILSQVRRLYRGWIVRLYTDPHGRGRVLCPLLRDHAHLYVCDVTSLPPPLGNLSLINAMMWRIAPLGDPQVHAMLARDTDSMIITREAEAVSAWWSSGKAFHIMRDHPNHDFPILGGLWGARWDQYGGGPSPPAAVASAITSSSSSSSSSRVLLTAGRLAALRDDMLRRAQQNHSYGDDQTILAEVLWPAMEGQVVTHDSFWCQEYENDSLPWPTQRHDGRFAGYRRFKKKFQDEKIPDKCPLRCRPPDHPNWLYC